MNFLLKRTGGVPTDLLQGSDENADALDRMEQGMLAGEKARSEAKTKECSGSWSGNGYQPSTFLRMVNYRAAKR